MINSHVNSLEWLQFSNLLQFESIGHFVSTRIGGVSTGVFQSLNLGLSSGDDLDHVLKNRTLLARAAGLEPGQFVVAEQVHSATVAVVTAANAGKGMFDAASAIAQTDALITQTPGLCLVAKSADCVPVLLYDPENHAVAAIHSGWKGTMQCIAAKTVTAMKENFGTRPSALIAGIGPSNGPCCYEVGDDVVDTVAKVFDSNRPFLKYQPSKKKFHLDLWKTNEFILLEAGVNRKNIEIAALCTQCNPQWFYSARRKETGRIFAGIFLKGRL